ncbi:MAG: hypothetical protein CFE29_28585 [Bradyrhizobiaceae bacterium PARB1]|nr:MAG: hypothetical protein CFE29_28585 [Bradyrhizobiaceae bacterium PARB1]
MPPAGFASRTLSLVDVARGAVWRRLYQNRFPNALGYGFSPSRFSDPETTLVFPERFGVVYFGNSIKVCFVEAILRDRGVARTHTFPIEWSELEAWTCAEVRVEDPLRVVDLRGDGLVRMGIPTDVARASSQGLARIWSRALWAHDAHPDGLMYDSRLNGETNVVVFDRAIPKLTTITTPRLVDCRDDLATILTDLDLAIV